MSRAAPKLVRLLKEPLSRHEQRSKHHQHRTVMVAKSLATGRVFVKYDTTNSECDVSSVRHYLAALYKGAYKLQARPANVVISRSLLRLWIYARVVASCHTNPLPVSLPRTLVHS